MSDTDARVMVHVHVGPQTDIETTIYADQNRVAVRLGDSLGSGSATIFMKRPELDRLAFELMLAKATLSRRADGVVVEPPEPTDCATEDVPVAPSDAHWRMQYRKDAISAGNERDLYREAVRRVLDQVLSVAGGDPGPFDQVYAQEMLNLLRTVLGSDRVDVLAEVPPDEPMITGDDLRRKITETTER